MQQSNGYIITFSIILTVVLGLLLSGTSQVLGPIQKKAEDLDNKKQILGAVMAPEELKALKPEEVLAYYESRIASKVVDIEGKEVEQDTEGNPIVAETVNVGKNYKKAPADRLYPVFIYHEEGNEDAAISYILPVYGAGLWDEIWGYVALQTDLNTIEGVTFSHKGETPGLGARITENGVQARYQGKKIFDDNGELQAVIMQKGEGKDYDGEEHKVDGLSGATITANGVNDMLKNYIGHYKPYLEKRKSGSSTGVAVLN
ncbi:NADH:ubiquinone reductase (Na(+)-transporting) subunit C [Belliella aquatica]|uniref:Na(+)-translocating NADH-quinone reductase subunit C n=1 Tax=Belliella aquatica TaxID=1323734 RepID=A0ABQ1MR65_9BACT|nr:NADH:ubiquinone reductase (Na(+)-transporting) subunit C [Belliella aquatica]MCH7406096.1 NADH:ubiquinone reductase (Na(+)-transporting) subunit C [Belliella aquatica]GGC45234.1 Na(+)-translocating NADH-quinone reductase subunit C [Belliella aquatica]